MNTLTAFTSGGGAPSVALSTTVWPRPTNTVPSCEAHRQRFVLSRAIGYFFSFTSSTMKTPSVVLPLLMASEALVTPSSKWSPPCQFLSPVPSGEML